MTVWYRQGTASIANGETAVTGHLTVWNAMAEVGDGISFDGGGTWYEIASVDGNTALTLATEYAGESVVEGAYAIDRKSPRRADVPRVALKVDELLGRITTLIRTEGKPDDGIGTDGSLAFDDTARVLYSKADGAWDDGISLVGSLAVDAAGTFAERDAHDDAEAGFVYLSTDGDGDELTSGVIFFKLSGESADWSEPVPFQGPEGEPGSSGDDGDDGWSPIEAIEADGDRRVKKVVDWVGGEGDKPPTGKYVGADGHVDDIGAAVDIRGPVGDVTPEALAAQEAAETAAGAAGGAALAAAGHAEDAEDAKDAAEAAAASLNLPTIEPGDAGKVLAVNDAEDGYELSSGGPGGGGISAVEDDPEPTLGGNLDLNNNDITGTGGIDITGMARFFADNSGTELSGALATIEQDGSGDAGLLLNLTGTRQWLVGIDNSDADAFKIATATDGAPSFNGAPFRFAANGRLGIGDAVTANRIGTGTASNAGRALSLIDTNGVIRIWRFATGGVAAGFELGCGTNETFFNNTSWEALVSDPEGSFSIGRRTGGVTQRLYWVSSAGNTVIGSDMNIGAGIQALGSDQRLNVVHDNSSNDSVTRLLALTHTTTGTPGAGIGAGMQFVAETSANNNEIIAAIDAVATTVTAAAEVGQLSFKTMSGGATAAERMSLDHNGANLSVPIALNDNTLSRPHVRDYSEAVNALGEVDGATDIDLELGNVVTATITDDTTFSFVNPPATGRAGSFTLILTDGGSNDVAWPASVAWSGGEEPELTESGVDILTFTTLNGGTTWYGFRAGADMQVPA